jgi:hypothetical protein
MRELRDLEDLKIHEGKGVKVKEEVGTKGSNHESEVYTEPPRRAF